MKSSVGVGTVVEVCLPVQSKPGEGFTTEQLRSSLMVFDNRLHGRTLCLITDEGYRSVANTTASGEMARKSKRLALVQRAIQVNACEAWGMELIVASKGPLPKADVYVIDSGALRDAVQDKGGQKVVLPLVEPLLILCSGAGAPLCQQYDALRDCGVHVHHPLGPRKFFSAVVEALGREREKGGGGDRVSVSKIVLPPNVSQPSPASATPEPDSSRKATAAESAPTSSTSPSSSSSSSPTLHLLLVDDNPININVLVAAVRKLKHTFATASDGLEAVQLYQKALRENRPFDMVWMDLQMPRMDGFEAIRQIRGIEVEERSGGKSEVVALTGLSSGDSKRLAMGCGADAFLTKPVRLAVIRGVLEDVLESKRRDGWGGSGEEGVKG